MESSETQNENDEVVIFELRNTIPAQILGHYDRLVARGKKGIAAVRHQTCTGCHMNVPLAVVLALQHGEDIQLCENCGRYLYLDETPEPAKPEKKKPSRRKSAQLASA
ncbi:MAG TPA: C4-type zinc ribbon domain-containing protein [Verrucomicrobiae bacterium]|nr:C4-type zinc ribbon domain-containing protein [Verrucomicrobiae bacterium]